MKHAARAGALAWAAMIFVLSHQPALPTIAGIPHVDKLEHLAAYALLGALLALSAPAGWSRRRAWLTAAVATAIYGATDEWHQSFVPGRSAELADWMADALGGFLGAMVVTKRPSGDDQ